MSFVAIVVILGAVLIGIGATLRLAPPLAPSPEGRLAFWIVANLVGAAAGVVVDQVWSAGRTLDITPLPTETVIVGALHGILLEGGVLIALASIVYLLGPRDQRGRD